jgi:pantetheine-phosphate adenylyltransferase
VRAIYPGSFDPATEGHLEIARRGAELFDELVVAIGVNPSKTGRFPVIDRVGVLTSALRDLSNVSIATFSGLLATYCRDNNIDLIIRGIRNKRDFLQEVPMAHMNRHLNGIDSLFLPASAETVFVSSTVVVSTGDDQ